MKAKSIKNLILISFPIIIFVIGIVLCSVLIPAYAKNWNENLTLAQTVTPYWKNENNGEITVYDEIVMPIRYGSSNEAICYLAYTPKTIVSVKNYSGEITYSSSQYSVEGNKISFAYNNGMPYVQDEWLDNKNVPSQYQEGLINSTYNDGGGTNSGNHVIAENALTRTNHLIVTYTYDSSQDLGFEVPSFQPENYPNLLKKLNNKEPVKILIFGDSISVGASASSMMGFAPYLPTWFELIKNYLVEKYYNGDNSKVTIVNESEGGQASSYGVEQLYNNTFNKTGFDLIIIGFGMNDASLQLNGNIFKSNISTILNHLRAFSPNADYILLGSFTANPKSTFFGPHAEYMPLLADLANKFNLIGDMGSQSGCTFVNMYEISDGILSKKQANNTNDRRYQYLDISANYTNHPNDYMIRLYAGAILSTFIDF